MRTLIINGPFVSAILLLCISALSLACTDLALNDSLFPQSAPGDFGLYVSNQSYAIGAVDIAIYLDDKLAVNQEFFVKSQHNWIRFKYDLGNGVHTIRAVSRSNQLEFKKSFELPATPWCVVNFWTGQSNDKFFSIDFFTFEPSFAFRESQEIERSGHDLGAANARIARLTSG